MNQSVFSLVAISVGLVIVLLFAIWQVTSTFVEIVRSKNDKRLKADIASALVSGEPTWEQIKIIESCYPLLPPNSLKRNLNSLIREEVIKGVNQENKSISQLESWSSKLKSDEPFEGIPPELKLPLERIRKEAPEHKHLVELLVSQLQEYTDQALSEKKRNKLLSVVSLIVGVGGFSIGVYQIYESSSLAQPDKKQELTIKNAPDKTFKKDPKGVS